MNKEELERGEKVLSHAEDLFEELSGGRVYDVGTMVLYNGKLGVVTDLNKDATDPTGSTVDIRLDSGKVIAAVKVNSSSLRRYRS